MKKFYLLLLAVMCSVGSAWSISFKKGTILFYAQGWNNPANVYFCIGKSDYTSVYKMTQVGSTDYYKVEIDCGNGWTGCTYFAIFGSANTWNSNGFGYSTISDNTDNYTAAYTSSYDIYNGEGYYYCTVASADNGAAMTITYANPKLSVSDAGWASFSLPFAATIPDGATVYYASSANENSVVLTEYEGATLPAGQGVLVKAAKADYTFIPAVPDGTISGNKLVAALTNTTLVGNANYVLAEVVNNLPVFKLYANGENDNSNITIAGNKAYLPASALGSANAPGRISFVIEEGTIATDVEAVEAESVVKFIENGQLMIKKNGVVYNAMGQIVK